MSILHLVSVNLQHRPELTDLVRQSAAAEDSILFLGEGIYSLAAPLALPGRHFVLSSDAAASGFQPVSPSRLTDYAGMLQLSLEHERCITWH